MRKILIIILLAVSLIAEADRWYIATAANGGSDTNGDGSISAPWLTLKHAADTITGVAFIGDTIVVGEGTFTETAITSLGVGVSIWGAGDASHIIYTYANSTWTNACIQLVSATEGTDGSQSISYVKIDGSSGTAYHGILARCRKNVTIDHVTMVDFKYNGVNFHGSDGYDEPTTYATGNKLSNCTITNCSAKAYELNTNGDGQVRISGQDGIEICDNVFDNTTAGDGYCANNIDFKVGYNKNMDIHDNKSYKPQTNGTDWNIHFESWDGMGGNKLYDNEFWGGGMMMDIGGHFNVIGASTYSWLVENNFFGNTEQPSYVTDQKQSVALVIEGDSRDVIVRYNHFKNTAAGIQMNAHKYTEVNVYDIIGVNVHYNVFEYIGYKDLPFRNSWVIELTSESVEVVIEDIYIDNNTIVSGAEDKADAALLISPKGTMDNIRLRNNIIVGMDIAPIYLYYYTGQVSNLYNQNNCLYDNGNNDLILYYLTPTVINYVVSDVITTTPQFISPVDLQLQSTSPAIDAGIDVSAITGGLDFHGASLYGAAYDIGAFEYQGTGRLLLIIDDKIATINYKIPLIEH